MNAIPTRLAAASGAFYAVAVLVGGVMEFSGADDGTDGASILASLQREPSVVNVVGFVLAMLGFVAFLVFLGYLHGVLRRAAGAHGWLAEVAVGAGLLSLAVKVGSIAPIAAGTYRKDEVTVDIARTLVDLNGAAFIVFGLLFGLFVAAAGAACLVHGVAPRWLGWVGALTGVLAFAAGVVGILAPAGYNPLAFVGGLIWTLVLSSLLTVRGARDPGPSEIAAARVDVAGVV